MNILAYEHMLVHMHMFVHTHQSQGVDGSARSLVLPGSIPAAQGTVFPNSGPLMLKKVPVRGPCSCGANKPGRL